MTVIVTGASGTIGRAACQALTEAGYQTAGLDRRAAPEAPCPVHAVDLRKSGAAAQHIQAGDVVVHLANHSNPNAGIPAADLYADNVAMTAQVFAAAVDAGAKQIIYASSVQIFAGRRHQNDRDSELPSCLAYLPLDGQEPPCPGNGYAASKEAGEALLRHHARLKPDLACTAVRWPMVADADLMDNYRAQQPAGQPRPQAMLDLGFSFLALPDAARFILALIERPRGGYEQLLPAARDNRLGWSRQQIIDQYYPNVEIRPFDPAHPDATGLVDLRPIERRLNNWQPQHSNVRKTG